MRLQNAIECFEHGFYCLIRFGQFVRVNAYVLNGILESIEGGLVLYKRLQHEFKHIFGLQYALTGLMIAFFRESITVEDILIESNRTEYLFENSHPLAKFKVQIALLGIFGVI